MKKKTVFPSESDAAEIRNLLSKSIASKPLAKTASAVDKIKHRLCKEFIIYKNMHNILQKDLAHKIGIDDALMSKILHYHFDEFTIDRLIKFLNVLYPNLEFNFDLAS